MWLAQDPQTRIREAGEQHGRAIGPAVVDDDDLGVGVRLLEQAGEAGAERVRAIVRRDDDGDVRHHAAPLATASSKAENIAAAKPSRENRVVSRAYAACPRRWRPSRSRRSSTMALASAAA